MYRIRLGTNAKLASYMPSCLNTAQIGHLSVKPSDTLDTSIDATVPNHVG